MKQLYWNVDPEDVVKQNKCFIDIDSNIQLKKSIVILCQEYKRVSNDIHKTIEKINGNNFEEVMPIIFDKEAYLAEIYFYLSEDILGNMIDGDILEIIRTDYLYSYYWKLEEMNQGENVEFFLRKWIKEKNIKSNNFHVED